MICTHPAPVNVVMSSNPSLSGAHVGEACGVPVDVAVAVGVGVNVAVGVGDGGVPVAVGVGVPPPQVNF